MNWIEQHWAAIIGGGSLTSIATFVIAFIIFTIKNII
jgi:hypothetical protein